MKATDLVLVPEPRFLGWSRNFSTQWVWVGNEDFKIYQSKHSYRNRGSAFFKDKDGFWRKIPWEIHIKLRGA